LRRTAAVAVVVAVALAACSPAGAADGNKQVCQALQNLGKGGSASPAYEQIKKAAVPKDRTLAAVRDKVQVVGNQLTFPTAVSDVAATCKRVGVDI
jgi:hypothetical protein